MSKRFSLLFIAVLAMLGGCLSDHNMVLVGSQPTQTVRANRVPAQAAGNQAGLLQMVQLAKVTVDWQHADILRQPQLEARRLSDIIYTQLDSQALIDQTSGDELQVTILEAFLRSDGRGRISSNYLSGSVALLGSNGEYKQRFRVKANYTQRGGDPIGIEDRLDKLYAKFSDLTVRELSHIQTIDSSVANNTTL